MEDINLKATLEEKVSKKGDKYYVIAVQLTDNLTKNVFLEPAEVEVLRMTYYN